MRPAAAAFFGGRRSCVRDQGCCLGQLLCMPRQVGLYDSAAWRNVAARGWQEAAQAGSAWRRWLCPVLRMRRLWRCWCGLCQADEGWACAAAACQVLARSLPGVHGSQLQGKAGLRVSSCCKAWLAARVPCCWDHPGHSGWGAGIIRATAAGVLGSSGPQRLGCWDHPVIWPWARAHARYGFGGCMWSHDLSRHEMDCCCSSQLRGRGVSKRMQLNNRVLPLAS
jgi:hypothetical protein